MLLALYLTSLCLTQGHEVSYMLSFRCFIVLTLTFRSIINFELIFLRMVDFYEVHFFAYGYPIFPETTCLKDNPSLLNSFSGFVKYQWAKM